MGGIVNLCAIMGGTVKLFVLHSFSEGGRLAVWERGRLARIRMHASSGANVLFNAGGTVKLCLAVSEIYHLHFCTVIFHSEI